MKRIITFLSLVSFVVLLPISAFAGGGGFNQTCSWTVPDKQISGDEHYGRNNWNWCEQSYLNNTVDIYGMPKKWWDDGFGWNDACNTDKPFARFMTADTALFASHPDPIYSSSTSIDYDESMLKWGGTYCVRRYDNLRAQCRNDDRFAAVTYAHTRCYLNITPNRNQDEGFFFGQDVPARAATLMHEAYHHKRANTNHVENGSQDQSFDSGAYRYTVLWHWWYAAESVNSSPALRCRSQKMGNAYLGASFVEDPGFTISNADDDCAVAGL